MTMRGARASVSAPLRKFRWRRRQAQRRIGRPDWMIQLDDALTELEKRDERKARLIEMRFFIGLTAEESAAMLEMDVRNVRRELRLAQAWLERALGRPKESEP